MFPFLALFAKISLSFAFTFLTMGENHIFENVLKEMEEVYVGGRGKSSSKYANLMFTFRFLHTQSTRQNISISNFLSRCTESDLNIFNFNGAGVKDI